MKLKSIAAALTVSALTYAGAGYAGGVPMIFNPDNPTGGTFTNFDEASNGTAFTTGFIPLAGTSFTLTYFADVVNIVGGTAVNPHIDGNAAAAVAGATYEYTVVAVLNESVVSCSADGSTCQFQINGGNFNVWFDNNPATFANNATGTGFTDGLLQLSGSIAASTGTQTFNTVTGLNVTGVTANINYTDTTTTDLSYISPALTTGNTVTTLQIGGFVTSTPAGGFGGTPFVPGLNVVFQADGNTGFIVPEPGSLALLGLGAAGLGLTYRRRRAA